MVATAMTPKQRVLTALKRGQPDRVPATPRTVWSGIKYIGRTVQDCYRDEDVYVHSQVACVEDLGVEAAWVIAGHMPLERCLGLKMLDSADDPASPVEHDLREARPWIEAVPRMWSMRERLVHSQETITEQEGTHAVPCGILRDRTLPVPDRAKRRRDGVPCRPPMRRTVAR